MPRNLFHTICFPFFCVAADGFKCYTLNCLTHTLDCKGKLGQETVCEPGQDACSRHVIGTIVEKKCTSKKETDAGCDIVGSIADCRCDTELCNGTECDDCSGASTVTKPIFYTLSAVVTIFVFN